MKNCFNFEMKYRSTKQLKVLNFETSDGTCWNLHETWICKAGRNVEHILYFQKENYNYRRYLISIEITSLSKGVSGKATFAGNAELRMTKFTIPLSTFDVFKYSSHPLLQQRRFIFSRCSFRYKVIITRTDTFDNNSFNIPNRENLSTYSDQMLSLCCDGKFSDIMLASGDSSYIPAHRSILAVRSYFFFNAFMKNINPDPDFIFDAKFNSEVLCDMLRFMYSGQVRPMNLREIFSLYTAANAYLIPSLENICHNLILPQITVDNVSDLLIEADTLYLLPLKASCIKFITEHFDEIRGVCPQWQEIEIYHPEFLDDVLIMILNDVLNF